MPDMVKSISQIFSNQVFRVPDYQRGYAWEEKQWSDLLEDLELLLEGRNHFTGTLVLHKSTDGSSKVFDIKGMSYYSFDIIDGQQRLTTIVILLKAIHEQMSAISEFSELAQGLEEMYLHHLDLNKQPFTKLTLNPDSQDYFANNVLDLHPTISGPRIRSHQRMAQAKKYFIEYLVSMERDLGKNYPDWLRTLYFKTVHQLKLIVYDVEDEMDAGVIFETMNDRGKSLTELELVKNFLLYLASKIELESEHDLNQRINSTWRYIYESLMVAELGGRQYEDQLLRAHWLMAYDYDTRRWQNNRSIKNRFSLRRYKDRHTDLYNDLREYLDSLQDSTTAYCDIRSPERKNAFNNIPDLDIRRQVVIWSTKLARLGARAGLLPLLIAVRLKTKDKGEAYLNTAKLCEKFDFRVYQWLRYRSNAGESRLYRLANQYYKAPDPKRLQDEIARAVHDYCPDNRFIERFRSETENWYRWGGITYFLYEYEHHLAGGRPVQMSWEALDGRPKSESVEHILPQTPDDPYWQERYDENQISRWTHDIGNLTLTYDNSSLSNLSFPEKKGTPGKVKRYAGSPLFIERQVASYDDWTVVQIDHRREDIESWSIDRWHVDLPPALPSLDESSIERMMAIADLNGIGNEFEIFHNAALSLKLNPRVRKGIQYRPPFNLTLSVMMVEIHPNGLWILFRLHNFAKFKGISQERVDELLQYRNKEWNWIPADEVEVLVSGLETLADDLLPKN